MIHATSDFWRGWLNKGEFPDHPWRGHLQRAALTLKGLTYAPTGALIAAPTTSLPETPGGERNWDYRYSWVRDATFALWGLYSLGFDFEANSFFYFIADQIRDGAPLHVMYGVGGETELEEYDPRPPHRLRPRAARADRQRRVGAGPARRLGGAARLGLPAPAVAASSSRASRGRGSSGRSSARSNGGASPTTGSGRCAASPSTSRSSKIMCWVALRSRRAPRRRDGPARALGALARRGRDDQGRRARQRRRRPRRLRPGTTARRRSTPRSCSRR